MKKEWELVNPEHYGKELEWNYWTGKPLKLDAKQGKEIIGGLKGLLMAGVLEVFQLIVRHDKLGMGIGKLLLDEAEKWAKKNGGHEVFLTTGTKWKAVSFYKKMGYELAAQLPNHYSKTDFVLFRKFLN